ncbi:hypothetical protein H0H92_001680 [Tricholoma furcatifolium]|nr:hypothetical protein H0H92_001680 [Tricholoma furcatifolium]
MSRTQTRVANDKTTTRDGRKYEGRASADGGDQRTKLPARPGVTTLSDLPPSQEATPGRMFKFGSYNLYKPEKSRMEGKGRHRTLSSSNAQPLGDSHAYQSTGDSPGVSRPRRSSVDYAAQRYTPRNSALPYDDRHIYHEAISDSRARHDEMETRLLDCQREKKETLDLLEKTTEKLEEEKQRNEELEADVKRLAGELATIKEQLSDSESRRRKSARALQESTANLQGMSFFLTKMDTMSEADVVAILDNLNVEIMQTSVLMANTLERIPRRHSPEPKTNERLFNRRALGKALVPYLEDVERAIDPMAIQLALQFCYAETCYVVIESWTPGDWRGDDTLKEIYASLKKTVFQTVAIKWRSLTRAQTKYKESQGIVSSYIRRRIADVLSLAGWPSDIPEIHDILSKFEERIGLIAELSLRLHQAVSENVMSGELKSRLVYPDEIYGRASIDEAFPDETYPHDRRLQSVSGTTDLGLVRIAGDEMKTLRKPKVVLLDGLRALLEGGSS